MCESRDVIGDVTSQKVLIVGLIMYIIRTHIYIYMYLQKFTGTPFIFMRIAINVCANKCMSHGTSAGTVCHKKTYSGMCTMCIRCV